MAEKKVSIIGAGPGGLTAAMLLQKAGYRVTVYEKQPYLGGRTGALQMEGFTFDLGPTFLMMLPILEEMFTLAGRKIKDYMDIRELEPMYRLLLPGNKPFYPSHLNHAETRRQIEALFPGNGQGYDEFLKKEKVKYEHLVPCLQIPYSSYTDFLSLNLLKALPYLDAHINLFDYLGRYFEPKDLRIAFTFQAKYLGMSPWQCPATFSLISHLEHGGGIWHPIGGLNQIPVAMAKVFKELGGEIHLNKGVKQVLLRDRIAYGVQLESGEVIESDAIFINADFGHAMHHLFEPDLLRKWAPTQLPKKGFSCSTFMLYLGVEGLYKDIPHHNIIFADDYQKNVDEIAVSQTLPPDPSFYIQNACVTDPSLAPAGMSTIYILVPVPNNRSQIDWSLAAKPYRDKIIELAESRGGLTGLSKKIRVEKVITPAEWEEEKFVHIGATFNLAHNVGQMLIWRPHNEFEEFKNVYLVGGGTHPGSGIPTILESGRISAKMLIKKDGKQL